MKELGEAFLGPFIEAACDCGNVRNSQCNTNREVAVFGRYETSTLLITRGNICAIGMPVNDFAAGAVADYGVPNRCLYSVEVMNAFTISAATKLPLNWFSLFSQNS